MELKPAKKLLIISSGQPSLNPRLVKEADALAEAGYQVTVVYAYWNDWGTTFDETLIPSKKWKAVRAGGDPHNKKAAWFLSRIIHKLAKITGRPAELAIARAGYHLMTEALRYRADLYIGHNLGALAATVTAAKAAKKPCGFDAEDFHRNEVSDDKDHPDVLLKTRLENKYFPQLDYLIASSPQIADAYQHLFPDKKPVVIRNVFPKDMRVNEPALNQSGPIRLFWFSQTIGTQRGLQDVIKALAVLNDQPFELHLLGYCSAEVKASLTTNTSVSIRFHAPLAPDDLALFASQFDIGLALEPGFNINNNLALSNKIFTYLQAGLSIIASDTQAQSSFIGAYPGIGKVYKRGDIRSLAEMLLYYHKNRGELLETRKTALTLAREKLNWEEEQKKLLALVKDTLDQY